jgi:sensor histidine kinase YesM
MWRSLKTALFLTYSAIILVVFVIFVLVFYSWMTGQLRGQAIHTLNSFGSSIQEQLAGQVEQMNRVSLNIMYSNLVKERFARYASLRLDTGGSAGDSGTSAEQIRKQQSDDLKALTEALIAIIGPSRLVEQIYLYAFDGRYYGTGFDTRELVYRPEEKPFITALRLEQSKKLLSGPEIDEQLAKFSSSEDGKYAMSLYRLLYDAYNVPIGVIEVRQFANRIFASAIEFNRSNPYNGHIYIADRNGSILYPFEHDDRLEDTFRELIAARHTGADFYTSIPFTDPLDGEKQLMSLHYTASTGWYTILTTSEKDLFRPLREFTYELFGTAFLLIAFGVGLSFYAAKKITFPIYRIRRLVRNISLERLGSGLIARRKLNSGFVELNELHDAFLDMSIRLKDSLDHLLQAETRSLQARLSALQSQMNPHFLYNTLANLQEMAEQNMNGTLVLTIERMSDFLRYMTSKERQVPLRDELDHTVNYLEINKVRFGDRLAYRVNMPESMLAQVVPKLSIQPLVENSLKFAAAKAPPWRIDIVGRTDEAGWLIEVCDNGPGFDSEKLAALGEKMAAYEQDKSFPALEVNGMGLLNLYLRLDLLYGDRKRFAIRNLPEGGASISFGGPTDKEG